MRELSMGIKNGSRIAREPKLVEGLSLDWWQRGASWRPPSRDVRLVVLRPQRSSTGAGLLHCGPPWWERFWRTLAWRFKAPRQ